MLAGMLYPAFLFMDFSIEFKVILMILYLLSMLNNCFIIAVFNNSFVSNVSQVLRVV